MNRRDRIAQSRLRVPIGLLAGLLLTTTFLFSALQVRGDEPASLTLPAAVALNWSTELNIAAPLDEDLVFDLEGCPVFGQSPCHDITILKSGALTLSSEWLKENLAPGAPIRLLRVPVEAWAASSFLVFDDGVTRTAFSATALASMSLESDVLRGATAANNAEKTTCATLFAGDVGTAVQLEAWGSDGKRARKLDGKVAPIDVFFLGDGDFENACLSAANFDAGSVTLSFGCGGIGPCPAPAAVYALVTKGPPSGATVETLDLRNVGTAPSLFVSSAWFMPPFQFDAFWLNPPAPIRTHGQVPADIQRAIDNHNATLELRGARQGGEPWR